jgi:hypothetical protein
MINRNQKWPGVIFLNLIKDIKEENIKRDSNTLHSKIFIFTTTKKVFLIFILIDSLSPINTSPSIYLSLLFFFNQCFLLFDIMRDYFTKK